MLLQAFKCAGGSFASGGGLLHLTAVPVGAARRHLSGTLPPTCVAPDRWKHRISMNGVLQSRQAASRKYTFSRHDCGLGSQFGLLVGHWCAHAGSEGLILCANIKRGSDINFKLTLICRPCALCSVQVIRSSCYTAPTLQGCARENSLRVCTSVQC